MFGWLELEAMKYPSLSFIACHHNGCLGFLQKPTLCKNLYILPCTPFLWGRFQNSIRLWPISNEVRCYNKKLDWLGFFNKSMVCSANLQQADKVSLVLSILLNQSKNNHQRKRKLGGRLTPVNYKTRLKSAGFYKFTSPHCILRQSVIVCRVLNDVCLFWFSNQAICSGFWIFSI